MNLFTPHSSKFPPLLFTVYPLEKIIRFIFYGVVERDFLFEIKKMHKSSLRALEDRSASE